MRKRTVSALAVAPLLLTSCAVASWQWDWAHRVESGYESSFRDVTAVCEVESTNELDGRPIESILREELGFVETCGDARHLDIEFRIAPGVSSFCGENEASAVGLLRVVGPGGVEAESTWDSQRCGWTAEEYARSYASAVRGFVIFGRQMGPGGF